MDLRVVGLSSSLVDPAEVWCLGPDPGKDGQRNERRDSNSRALNSGNEIAVLGHTIRSGRHR